MASMSGEKVEGMASTKLNRMVRRFEGEKGREEAFRYKWNTEEEAIDRDTSMSPRKVDKRSFLPSPDQEAMSRFARKPEKALLSSSSSSMDRSRRKRKEGGTFQASSFTSSSSSSSS